MIAVVSSNLREATALSVLAAGETRTARACTSVAQFKTLARKIPPTLVLARQQLSDGYSDDILSWLKGADLLPDTPVIVLARADCSAGQEARQIHLGAVCVLKDPLRPDVLVEYSSRILRGSRATGAAPSTRFTMAGATIDPDQQRLLRGRHSAHLSPKEIELARLLAEAPGQLVSYEQLYQQICGRSFDGDTANIRVLVGKLVASYKRIHVDLRKAVRVTPKSGYRYAPATTGKC